MRQPMRQTAILLNLVILAMMLSGCGPTQRQKTIHAVLIATNAARDGFVVWDDRHQLAIVERAPSHAEGAEQLADYRREREPIVKGFVAVYRAIAIASVLQSKDTRHPTALVVEALKLKAEVEAFIEARKGR